MSPFAPGSISLGLHPLSDLPADAQLASLIAQAELAESVGFDGVTLSEHHQGFPGYLPQPLLVSAVLLARTTTIWAGPCPMLLNLRNPALVAEELAWTAACFPGRLGAAVAPGYSEADFALVGASPVSRQADFATRVGDLVGLLSDDGGLTADPAVRRWVSAPAPLLSAANSVPAVERAAQLGLGVVFPGGEAPGRLGNLASVYRAAGGNGPVVWIKGAHIGAPVPSTESPVERAYRGAAAPGMRQRDGFRDPPAAGSASYVTDVLAAGLQTCRATAVNLRLHRQAPDQAGVCRQIEAFGAHVLPALRAGLRSPSPGRPDPRP